MPKIKVHHRNNDRREYVNVNVGRGVIFRYASYVREQEALLGYYLDCYHENISCPQQLIRDRGVMYTELAGEKIEKFVWAHWAH